MTMGGNKGYLPLPLLRKGGARDSFKNEEKVLGLGISIVGQGVLQKMLQNDRKSLF